MADKEFDLVVVGGGAAGFFHAINYKERYPSHSVAILEKSNKVLSKVKVSGGGRCNVTHACFDPKELVKHYPRGNPELIGPFNKFQPGDTIGWFYDRGVDLKTEEDDRMFPTTDNSQTIIDCFMRGVEKHNIPVLLNTGVEAMSQSNSKWKLVTSNGKYSCKRVFIGAGSSKGMWKLLSELGHSIVEPVPSLFAFKIKDKLITGLMGLSVPFGGVSIPELKIEEFGPVLITHWGLSGPGILKISSVGARALHNVDYKFIIKVNWNTGYTESDLYEILVGQKQDAPSTKLSRPHFEIPKRLWTKMLEISGIDGQKNVADLKNEQLRKLSELICNCPFSVDGKATFKEEFVTAGGIDLKEVDFRTMESKQLPGVYFGGEVLNIDALTGGFNFQAAWTTAWLAAQA